MRHRVKIRIAGHPTDVRFVALFDNGKTGGYGHEVLTAFDVITQPIKLATSSCFFKLLPGAFALVDIYKSESDPDEPLLFNYQVFECRVSVASMNRDIAAFEKVESMMTKMKSEFIGADDENVRCGGRCGTFVPCGGVTEIDCCDPYSPSTHYAHCNDDNELECRERESGGGG